MLTKDIIKEFIYECEIRKLSKRTVKSYRNNNLQFINFTENQSNITELEEINHLHIKEYFKYLMEKGLTKTYINGILKCLRAFYKYCTQEGYLGKMIKLLNYDIQNSTRIKNDLLKIETKDKQDVIAFVQTKTDFRENKILINPNVIYGGLEDNRTDLLRKVFV